MNQPLAEILYSENQIQERVRNLAQEIRSDLGDERPLFIAVLKGSVIFLADLLRALEVDADVDFMSISSYLGGAEHTGVVRIMKDAEMFIEDRSVIVVEDIVDTGLTLAFLLRTLQTRNPRSLKVCTLIDKAVRRIAEPDLHYVGFQTEKYVVGYGLDFKGRYRNLPYLAGVNDLQALVAEPDSLGILFERADG